MHNELGLFTGNKAMNHNRTRKLFQRGRGTRKLQKGGRIIGSALKAIQGQARLITKIRRDYGQRLGHGSGASFQFMTLPEDMGSIFVKMTIDEGLEDVPAAGGEFIFLLELPENFPINPPNWFMFTEVARCDRGARLCLNPISGWHVSEWQALKDKRTIPDMLSGFASHFMRYGGDGSHGVGWKAIQADITKEMIYPVIQAHAAASRAFNIGHFKRGEVYRFLASNIVTVSGDMSAEIIAFRAELLRQSEIRPDESLMDKFCDVIVFGEQECPPEFASATTATVVPAAALPLRVIKISGAGAETEAFTVPPEFDWSHLDIHDGKFVLPIDFTAGDILALETIMKRKFIGANLGQGRLLYIPGIAQENIDKAKELLFGTRVGGLSELNVKSIQKINIRLTNLDGAETTISITLPELISKFRVDLPLEIQFDSDVVVATTIIPERMNQNMIDVLQRIARDEPVLFELALSGAPALISINSEINPRDIENVVSRLFTSNILKRTKAPTQYALKRGDLMIELGIPESAFLSIAKLNSTAFGYNIIRMRVVHDRTVFDFSAEGFTEDDLHLLHRILKAEEYLAFYYFYFKYELAVADGLDPRRIERVVYTLFDKSESKRIPGLNRRPTTQIFVDETGAECRLENVDFLVKHLRVRSFAASEVIWEYNKLPNLDACEFIKGRPGIVTYDSVKYIPRDVHTLLRWGIPVVETTTPVVDRIRVNVIQGGDVVYETAIPIARLGSLESLVNGKFAQTIAEAMLGLDEKPIDLVFDGLSEKDQVEIVDYCEGRLKQIVVKSHKKPLYTPNYQKISDYFSFLAKSKPSVTTIELSDVVFDITVLVDDTIYQEGSITFDELIELDAMGVRLDHIIHDAAGKIIDTINESTKHIPVMIRVSDENTARCLVDVLSKRPVVFVFGDVIYHPREYSSYAIENVKAIVGEVPQKQLPKIKAFVGENIYNIANIDCFMINNALIERIIEAIEDSSIESDSIVVDFTGPTEAVTKGVDAFFKNGTTIGIVPAVKKFLFGDMFDDYLECVREDDSSNNDGDFHPDDFAPNNGPLANDNDE